ncbi:DP-EP family protein [Azospirillum sp. B4]|uniref:DP-EP family protein n=1 Tax=Azospirillum sp. B4 TaxID=95605 RepID=UPI000349E987|nr:DP-EP family protein [Azospirillum sp. B4]
MPQDRQYISKKTLPIKVHLFVDKNAAPGTEPVWYFNDMAADVISIGVGIRYGHIQFELTEKSARSFIFTGATIDSTCGDLKLACVEETYIVVDNNQQNRNHVGKIILSVAPKDTASGSSPLTFTSPDPEVTNTGENG